MATALSRWIAIGALVALVTCAAKAAGPDSDPQSSGLQSSGLQSSGLQSSGFDNQILPIVTKAGCNTGACHGAAIGRGGFQLSLYGQDPALDWKRIVRHFGGRRVNFVDAERSLLLRKAGEFIEHGGGQVLDPDGEDWKTLVAWIRQGAPRAAAEAAPALLSIRTEPGRIYMESGSNPEVAFRVLATMEDGSQREMTPWAVLTSLDPQSLVLGEQPGIARAARPGRHVLLVRVRDKTTALEVLLSAPRVPSGSQAASLALDPGMGIIDGYIDQRLAELGIRAADRRRFVSAARDVGSHRTSSERR